MKRIVFGLLGLALLALGVTMIGLDPGVPPGSAGAILKADLFRKDGEDPSAPGVIAEGDGKLDDQGRLSVGLDGLDPARYPAGNLCRVELKAGKWSVREVPIEPSEEIPGANAVGERTTLHSVKIGDKAEVSIRCEFNGQRHETRWEGVFEAR